MRLTYFGLSALLLCACFTAEEDDVTIGPLPSCQNVEPHRTADVTGPGHYNVTAPGGAPGREGCRSAYIVDFVSTAGAMSHFAPDREWLEPAPAASACRKTCNDVEYSPFSAGISLYRCTTAQDCAAHRYPDAVGAFPAVYSDVLIGGGCVPRPTREASVPVAENALGVRMVVKWSYELRDEEIGCKTGLGLPIPAAFNFSAAGTAHFGAGGRPPAGPVP